MGANQGRNGDGRRRRAAAGPPRGRLAVDNRPSAGRRRWPPLLFLFSFSFSFLSLPCFFFFPFIFTAAVARPAGEGRPNPTGCRPSAGGGHCPGLGPSVPAGTPPGPNQHTGAGLAPVQRRTARQPSLPSPATPSAGVADRGGTRGGRARHGHGTTRPWLG